MKLVSIGLCLITHCGTLLRTLSLLLSAITKLRMGNWVQFCRPKKSNSATRQNTNPVSRKTSRMLMAHAYVQ